MLPIQPLCSRLVMIRLLLLCVLTVTGCQTWRSSSAIPGIKTSRKENKKVIEQAKNDPFPSPGQVGLTSVKQHH